MIKLNLEELVQEGVISQQAADRIIDYQAQKPDGAKSKLLIAFGILGALLVGLGIILIIAHNWENLSKWQQTLVAFLPLAIGQGFAGFTLFRKPSSVPWREGSSIFLFCAMAVCISVISQIYHLPGDLSSFVLTWMLLALPILYVMQSAVASLGYIIGITYFAAQTGYWSDGHLNPHYYWLLLLAALPFYRSLVTQKPNSAFSFFHHWAWPISITCTLGIVARSNEFWMFSAYISLFGCFLLIGNASYFRERPTAANGYLIIGLLGILGLFMAMSFSWIWDDLQNTTLSWRSLEFIVAVLLTIAGTLILYWKIRQEGIGSTRLYQLLFLIFSPIFLMGFYQPFVAQVVINLLVLATGIGLVIEGAKKVHLGMLNFGLVVISILIICRFFDTEWSFVARGIMFVILGLGFFVANYFLIKRRARHDEG